jgi:soluble lytic murein transglycosylase-like protein
VEAPLNTPTQLLCFVAVSVTTLTGGALIRIQLEPPPLDVARPSIPAQPFSIDEVVHAAARMHNVAPGIIKSVIAAESGFDQAALSPVGAVGLMQLMPETASDLHCNPSVAEENIQGGTQYLAWLMERYQNKRDGVRWAIAAYNAGPGTVEKYRGIPPFKETRAYVTRVLRYYKKYRDCNRSSNALRHAHVDSPESAVGD